MYAACTASLRHLHSAHNQLTPAPARLPVLDARTSAQHRYTQHQHPGPSTRHPVSTKWTGSASSQHRHRPPRYCQHPAPAPCLHHAHSQLTAPSTSTTARTSIQHLSPPAHSQHRAPAPAPCLHHVHSQLTAPAPAPAAGTQHQHRHQQPVSTTCTASSQHQHQHQYRHPAPATCLESAHGQLIVS